MGKKGKRKQKFRLNLKWIIIPFILILLLFLIGYFFLPIFSGNAVYSTSAGKTISVKLNDQVTFTCNSPAVTAKINNLQRSLTASQNNLQLTDSSTGKYYYATFTSSTASSASGTLNIKNVLYPIQITGGVAESEVYNNIITISYPSFCSSIGTSALTSNRSSTTKASCKSAQSVCSTPSDCCSKKCITSIKFSGWKIVIQKKCS